MKIHVILFSASFLALSACLAPDSDETKDQKKEASETRDSDQTNGQPGDQKVYDKKPDADGTVYLEKLDGCGFLIKLNSGEVLYPLNLEKEFWKDGLKISFKYRLDNQHSNVCMVGKIVKLSEVSGQ